MGPVRKFELPEPTKTQRILLGCVENPNLIWMTGTVSFLVAILYVRKVVPVELAKTLGWTLVAAIFAVMAIFATRAACQRISRRIRNRSLTKSQAPARLVLMHAGVNPDSMHFSGCDLREVALKEYDIWSLLEVIKWELDGRFPYRKPYLLLFKRYQLIPDEYFEIRNLYPDWLPVEEAPLPNTRSP